MDPQRLYTMMIHPESHSKDEVILNRDLFLDMLSSSQYLQIYDPDYPLARLVLKVPTLATLYSKTGTLEVSLSKSIAESFNLKAFSKVCVQMIDTEDAHVDFVELAFRRQFLQRGNMWRFKRAMFGRPVRIGEIVAVDGIQAQIQELSLKGTNMVSGVITEQTHFIFRSRSTRIIWLVQLSCEMWEYDPQGDLHVEKFFAKFADPLFDHWKALGASHSLTVIYFTRSLYLEDPNASRSGGPVVRQDADGAWFEDFFKVVIENSYEIDKIALLKVLKKEFWDFARDVNWNIDKYVNIVDCGGSAESSDGSCPCPCVPSDASSGNVLEAINTTLNLLDKHYMDRDLLRTGNSIVMITAGTGVFRVDPILTLISKQRMMDSGVGLDLISLSQPPRHAVPLFQCVCGGYGLRDFYVTPPWVSVSFVDSYSGESSSSNYYYAYSSSTSSSVERASALGNIGMGFINAIDQIKKESRRGAAGLAQRDYRWSGLDVERDGIRGAGALRRKKASEVDTHHAFRKHERYIQMPFSEMIRGHLTYDLADPLLVHAHALSGPLKKLLTGRVVSLDAFCGDSSSASRVEQEGDTDIPEWGDIDFASIYQSYRRNQGRAGGALCRGGTRPFSRRSIVLDALPQLPQREGRNHSGEGRNHSGDGVSPSSFGQLGRYFPGRPPAPPYAPGESYTKSPSSIGSDAGGYYLMKKEMAVSLNAAEALAGASLASAAPTDICKLLASGLGGARALALMDEHDSKIFTDGRCASAAICAPSAAQSGGVSLAGSGLSSAANSSLTLSSLLPIDRQPAQSSSSSGKQKPPSIVPPPSPTRPRMVSNYNLVNQAASSRESRLLQVVGVEGGLEALAESPQQGSLQARGGSADYSPASLSTPFLAKAASFAFKKNTENGTNPSNNPSTPNSSNTVDDAVSVIQKFMARNRVNPFVREEGLGSLRRRTHNRARWSHVFPSGKLEQIELVGPIGLHWKKLCQPAILPLETSYVPSVATLSEEYHIQGDYDLIMDKGVCAFSSAEHLLTEMICQRLAQEYQLVELDALGEGAKAAYKRYIQTHGRYGGWAPAAARSGKGGAGGADKDDKELFFILSMGHRIQFLLYDPALSQVRVTRLLSVGGGSHGYISAQTEAQRFTYSYKIWVPQTGTYQQMTQTFLQYATPEYAWNTADEILLGNVELDFSSDNVRAKRLRFCVLPDYALVEDSADGGVESYFNKIDKLLAHVSRLCAGGETFVDVVKDRGHGRLAAEHEPARSASNVAKIWLQGPNHANPKWAFFKYDSSASVHHAFRLEFHWLACDSWLMEDFVNVLFRRCSGSWGLRMVQIPEFFGTANLHVHPFRAQPFIAVPAARYLADPLLQRQWTSPVRLVEALLFRSQLSEWLEDDEQYTDWEGLGLPVPSYHHKGYYGADGPAAGETRDAETTKRGALSLSLMRAGGRARAMLDSVKKRRPRATTDRQYMHRRGFAAVRVGAVGFVWLLNSSGRTSDPGGSAVSTKEQAVKKLQEVGAFCERVGLVYDLLLELVERLLVNVE